MNESPSFVVNSIDSAESSLHEVAHLMERCFGRRGDEVQLLERWGDDPDRCVQLATRAREVVGMGVATFKRVLDFRWYQRQFSVELAPIFRTEPVVVFSQLAVNDPFRRNGVATAIGHSLLAWARRRAATVAIGISWDHGLPHNSGALFEGAGFQPLGKRIGFYRQFHEETGQRCVICAPQGCECSATLFGAQVSALVTKGTRRAPE